jgi:glucokinase
VPEAGAPIARPVIGQSFERLGPAVSFGLGVIEGQVHGWRLVLNLPLIPHVSVFTRTYECGQASAVSERVHGRGDIGAPASGTATCLTQLKVPSACAPKLINLKAASGYLLAAGTFTRTFEIDLDRPLPGPRIRRMADHSLLGAAAGSCVGIEIGGTKLQIVQGNPEGAIQTRHRFTVDRAQGGPGIRHQIAQCLASLRAQGLIGAVGVGFGGPVDRDSGQICCSHQIEGWSEFPLRQWLESIAAAPVTVENDANTAALGEALRGAGVGHDPVFYVTLGSGVGGGLVHRHSIYHGAKPGEAEIGHVRLNQQGDSVESRCSGWAVDRRIRERCREQPDSVLARLTTGQTAGEATHLADALRQGDAVAIAILEETARNLAFALSHVTHLFHPEVLILGGGLSKVGELLRASVQRHLAPYLMTAFQPGPEVRLATLGEDAVPVGALLLAGKSLQQQAATE